MADKAGDLQKFIQRARQVTRLTELTPEIVHKFIEKIVVSKPEKAGGKRRQLCGPSLRGNFPMGAAPRVPPLFCRYGSRI